jgi:hypothetical protein
MRERWWVTTCNCRCRITLQELEAGRLTACAVGTIPRFVRAGLFVYSPSFLQLYMLQQSRIVE